MKNQFKIFITALGDKDIYKLFAAQLAESIRTYVHGNYEVVLITDVLPDAELQSSYDYEFLFDDIVIEDRCSADWATMGRFERLLKYSYTSPDWLIYCDADMLVVDDIYLDRLVEDCPEEQFVIPTIHPGYIHTAPEKLPYDWKLAEMTWITTKPYRYYCGGFQLYKNNEEGRHFLQDLQDTTDWYLNFEEYTPLWRDESVFNALIPEVKYYLSPEYCMPDDRLEKFHLYESILHLKPKILARTK